MIPGRTRTPVSLLAASLGLALLGGCASTSMDQSLARTNDEIAPFANAPVALARTPEQRAQQQRSADALLAKPLAQADAVRLALLHSPALHALLAQGVAESADAAQSGRIANPVLRLERMLSGDERELGRALSVGLLDLLTLPARQRGAALRMEQAHLRLAGTVVDHVTQVRQAWVRAVAAAQALAYARQVQDSAQAGATLAQRMQAVGNYSRLARARQQVFYADAASRLVLAQNQAVASKEALARLLGLTEAQVQTLRLPDRLPDLPAAPLDAQALGAAAGRARLDIRLAQAVFDGAVKAQGLGHIDSITDIEIEARHTRQQDRASGAQSSARGWEIAVRLPLFDGGGLQREAMDARTLAAAHDLEATMRAAGSHLRESYAAYRSAYDLARHLRDEVLPLRKLISDENQLRYNGMLIGVFELLADAREQVGAVIAALDAQQQFWLADAALQASVVGRPGATALSARTDTPGAAQVDH